MTPCAIRDPVSMILLSTSMLSRLRSSVCAAISIRIGVTSIVPHSVIHWPPGGPVQFEHSPQVWFMHPTKAE